MEKINILITGAGKGIGFELVKTFAIQENRNIIAISRNIDQLMVFSDNAAINKTTKVFPVKFDLDSGDYDKILLPLILQIIPKIDILINNAGILINKPFYQQTDDDFDKQFGVNIKAVFKMSRLLFHYFNRNAHIVNISSMGGFQGSAKFKGLSLYSASKGALAIYTECMAEELKDKEVKANCLALGAAQTEMLTTAFPGYTAPLSAAAMSTFIADFALKGHHFINGKVIPISLSVP